MSLVLKNVSKTFEDSQGDVLNGINLEIRDGEFVCVVGQSGCGKSTLLNLIAGLEKPTDGEILLDGRQVDGPSAERVVMFQEHALFPWLSVIENVKFGMKLAGIPQKEQEETAVKYLRMMQLEDCRDYAIHQLSGGMRQRVALARALTLDSKLLLMDEPFSALDKQTSNRLRGELQDIWLKTNRTILFITHSVEEAVYLADRVIVMSPARNSIADIISIELERPRHVYDEKFMEYRHRILEKVQENVQV
ncbi:MAG: ABC transporter ATP-binding protein [Dorea sp.]|nr:ABC transporter ATP-binding protein [Dorea sp.]